MVYVLHCMYACMCCVYAYMLCVHIVLYVHTLCTCTMHIHTYVSVHVCVCMYACTPGMFTQSHIHDCESQM